ncbi:TPA: hypothetical protein ACYZXQ_004876, partial [Escherichia coli]
SFFFLDHQNKHNIHNHTTKQNQNIILTTPINRKTLNIEVRCNLDSAYSACDQHSPFFSVTPQMQNKQA